MKIIDTIFNLISIVTLTGASDAEYMISRAFPVMVMLFLLVTRMDFNFYSALLSRKIRFYRGWSESTSYLLVASCGTLLSLFFPATANAICMVFVLIGGCYHSLGGSICMRRVMICGKLIGHNALKKSHPNGVHTIKINGEALPTKTVNYACGYFLGYIVVVLIVAFILSFEAPNLTEALTNSAGLIGNDFYVINLFGNVHINLADYSAGMKLFMCLLMLAGRVKTLAVLKSAFWQR